MGLLHRALFLPCLATYGLSPRGPSNSFTIFTPHSATLLHTTHARNSSNSGLCFQDLAHSFIFRIQQVLCLPLLRKRPGVYQQFPFRNSAPCACQLAPQLLRWRCQSFLPLCALCVLCDRRLPRPGRGVKSFFFFRLSTLDSQLPSPWDLSAFFSHSCRLFCTQQKVNSF